MPGRQAPLNGHKRPARAQEKSRREPASQPRSALGAAAEAVSHVVSLQSQTRSALEDQRRSLAGGAHKVRDALRSASQLAKTEYEPFSDYLDRAGQKAEDVAQYITSADLRRLRSDAERIAQSHPGWFVGGAVVAGLVLGRLLKASGPNLLSAASEGT